MCAKQLPSRISAPTPIEQMSPAPTPLRVWRATIVAPTDSFSSGTIPIRAQPVDSPRSLVSASHPSSQRTSDTPDPMPKPIRNCRPNGSGGCGGPCRPARR